MSRAIFTIGHSNHSIEHFLNLLNRHGIEAVADVRSSPYSRFNPQYNRENLRESLEAAGIRYVFLGKELGARSEDPSCYRDNRVQYDLLAKTPLFQSGIERVLEGADKYRIALMCAETEPLACHRTILVARELEKQDVEIRHTMADGSLETHADAMERLIRDLGLAGDDLFITGEECWDLAYERQAERINK